MKKIFILIAFLGFLGNVSAQDLVCAWHYDTLLASPNTQVVNPADSGILDGIANVYLDGTAGSSIWVVGGTTEVNSFAGTTLNDGRLSPAATSSLALVGSNANGKSLVIGFSMFGYENPVLAFATRGTGTGFSTHIYAYSTDGITYTNFDTVAAAQTSTWVLETIDLTSYNVLDDSPIVYIRITFDGASSTAGNNRLDNISIYASSISGGDIVPPVVQSAAASSASNVWVVFNEAVGVSAENTANYSGLGTINTAVRTTGLDSVQLTLATPLTFGVPDTVCVDNVADTAGNVMLASQCFEVQYGVIDMTPPTALSAWAVDINTVMVTFDEALKDTSAQNIAHYTGLTPVSTAVLSASLDTVTLNLSSSLTSGVMDTLYVEGVRDSSNNPMASMQMFQIYIDTSTTAPNLVITEIMYNPPESGQDSLEFIEIYNNGSTAVNIFNYELNYGSSNYIFDSTIFIAPASYFLIGIKADKADAFYGMPFYQGPTVGLGNSGTTIEIRTAGGLFVDSVMYDDVAPWPTEAAGNGYSLAFCDPNLDNNDGSNWGIGTIPFSVVNGNMVYANPGQGCTAPVDTVAPIATAAWAADFSTVKVVFDEAVETTSGQNTANYTGLGTVNTAVLNTGTDTVTLSLATPLISGVADTLYVTGISDLNTNTMSQVYEFIIILDTSTTAAALVITEIMYNPPESGTDSLEFIELYNNGSTPINILNYELAYSATVYSFDTAIIINPATYFLVGIKADKATAFYGVPFYQGPSVGFTNGGTFITLKNSSGVLVDSVMYDDIAPWPTEAAGNGYSLSFCDPNLDNNIATNWGIGTTAFSVVNGSMVYANPGQGCTPAIDTIPPIATSAWATDFSTVKVRFNEAVETSSGQNTANYTGLGTVNTAVLNTGTDTVTLSLATPLVSGVPDTLYVTGINDLNTNLMTQVYEFVILLDTSSTAANLVITEIMYNPPESGIDSLEFIEIYNNDVSVVNLLDYKISYGTTFKVIDVGFNLNPGAYAVISINPAAADAFYSFTSIPGPAVGISNGGTSITLHNPSGILVDSVAYLPTSPWPVEANGGGHSLTLCDPSSDNNDAMNWSYSANFVGFEDTLSVFADPEMSCVITSIVENTGSAFNVYPNPANNVLHIDGLENAEAVSLYNAMGALMQSSNISGENSFEMSLKNLPEALYIVRVHFNDGTIESRMVMIAR